MIVSIVYILYIFNQLIKQFMLIPVINRHIMKNVAFSNFNELFLNIYSQLTKHKSIMLSTSFFLVCLTIMKLCAI